MEQAVLYGKAGDPTTVTMFACLGSRHCLRPRSCGQLREPIPIRRVFRQLAIEVRRTVGPPHGASLPESLLCLIYVLTGAATLCLGKRVAQRTPRVHELLDERIPHVLGKVRVHLASQPPAHDEIAPVGRSRMTGGIWAGSP